MVKTDTTPAKLQQTQRALAQLWTNTEYRKEFLERGGQSTADYGQLHGLSKSGIALYSELLQNNAEGLMDSIFPACKRLFPEAIWTRTIESYLRECPPDTYHLNSLARKFSGFLKVHEGDSEFAAWPFLSQLADFEWVELEVEEHPAQSVTTSCTELTSQEVIATMVPLINPAHTCRDYDFQVHEITRTILEDEKGDEQKDDDKPGSISSDSAAAILDAALRRPICLVFFRDPATQICRTLELGSAAQLILKQAQSGKNTYADLLRVALDGTPADALEEMLEKALALFAKFHEVGLFVSNFRR